MKFYIRILLYLVIKNKTNMRYTILLIKLLDRILITRLIKYSLNFMKQLYLLFIVSKLFTRTFNFFKWFRKYYELYNYGNNRLIKRTFEKGVTRQMRDFPVLVPATLLVFAHVRGTPFQIGHFHGLSVAKICAKHTATL